MSEVFKDDHHKRSDASMINAAIRKRWNISDELRDEVIAEARRMVKDPSIDKRAKSAAMKIVLEADKMNQADEHLNAKHERLDDGKATEVQKITVEYVNKLPEIE